MLKRCKRSHTAAVAGVAAVVASLPVKGDFLVVVFVFFLPCLRIAFKALIKVGSAELEMNSVSLSLSL